MSDQTDVAVIVTGKPPTKSEFKSAEFSQKALDGFRLYLLMLSNGAKIWSYAELARESGLKSDYCRRIINAMCQTAPPMVMEVPGGWMIAHSIRRINRQYINSLGEIEKLASRQTAIHTLGDYE